MENSNFLRFGRIPKHIFTKMYSFKQAGTHAHTCTHMHHSLLYARPAAIAQLCCGRPKDCDYAKEKKKALEAPSRLLTNARFDIYPARLWAVAVALSKMIQHPLPNGIHTFGLRQLWSIDVQRHRAHLYWALPANSTYPNFHLTCLGYLLDTISTKNLVWVLFLRILGFPKFSFLEFVPTL